MSERRVVSGVLQPAPLPPNKPTQERPRLGAALYRRRRSPMSAGEHPVGWSEACEAFGLSGFEAPEARAQIGSRASSEGAQITPPESSQRAASSECRSVGLSACDAELCSPICATLVGANARPETTSQAASERASLFAGLRTPETGNARSLAASRRSH